MNALPVIGLILILTLLIRTVLLMVYFGPLEKASFVGAAKQAGVRSWVGSGLMLYGNKTVAYHPFFLVFLRGKNIHFGWRTVRDVWKFDSLVLSTVMWLEMIAAAFLIISR